VRPVIFVIALAFAPIVGIAIGPAYAAEVVALADLEGAMVEADVHRDQIVRNQKGTTSLKMQQTWQVSIDDQKYVEYKVTTTRRGPGGTQTAKPNLSTRALDEPYKTPSRGGGEALWAFTDGTLIFTRTFPSGAYRLKFAFAKGQSGLTCTVTEAFARENGRGEIKMISPFSGNEVTIVSAKQLPSTCHVTRKN
jgi:hypothetical protein